MAADEKRVLIAGGGPVGLLCAWLLGRRGLPIVLFDDNDALQTDPRAATTHPATLELLAEDGLADNGLADNSLADNSLADDMARVGLVAPIFQFWDRPSGELVAQFDHALLAHDTRFPYVVQCEQFKTAKLLLQRLRKLANVEVCFGHKVLDVAQTESCVSVDV